MILHTLTAVLIVLKLMELITIGWFLVFLPTIFSFSLVFILMSLGLFVAWKNNK